ncbi:PriCT-2 domain-containing protein [Advenella sp. WQ 585]|uniref:PriCT-2 domain-containing protein n=1 Tax=Advenella mandrilli TaxID=2800330 RepID=A0ABS1ECF0_9BURK|nr:LPD7 domain-containing protein [Advenella mandrilli]MBK1781622.1 PriCT-2 domain-containing protein [Advenella mandrilli]
MSDYNEIERALSYVSNSDDRELWVRMGAGIKTELGEDGFDLWDRWSQTADNYQSQSAKAVWKSLKPGRVNIGSVFHEAKNGGYKPDKTQFKPVDPENFRRKAQERQQREQQAITERLEAADKAKDKAQVLFNKGDPVNPNHPYLLNKGIADPVILANLRQQGNHLLVPVKQNKEIVAVQKINPNGSKYFGKDEMLTGSAFLIGDASKSKATGLILTEGLATGASLHAATGKPVLVVFAAHNLVAVAENIKKADFPIVLAADNDSKTKNAGLKFAQKAAEILGSRAEIKMPVFDDKDTAIYQDKHGVGKYPSDFNDLHEIRGLDAVRQVIGETQVLIKNDTENEKESTMKLQESDYFKGLPEPDQEQSEPVDRGSDQAENYIEVDLEQIKAKAVPLNKELEEEALTNLTGNNTKTAEKESVQEPLKPSVQPNNQSVVEQPPPITDLQYKAPPESLKNKYLYADGMYLDVNGRTTVFVDSGKQLKTSKSDLQTVHDMVEVAKDKGWSHIKLFGNHEFKRQAFLEAESQGIKTTGYQPTPEDLAALKHLQDERALNKLENIPVLEKGLEKPEQGVKERVSKEDLNAGVLVDHGAAPYMHDEKNKMNYFVTLKQGEKEHTVWGLGLEDALNKSNAKVGDELSLKNIGRQAVEVDAPIFDTDGKTVISHEKIVSHRNEWEATIFNKKEVETEKQEPIINNQSDKQNDKSLQAQAAAEADKLKAQNQMPTAAQIESSPKADIDSDVRMTDIGGQSVNSEVKIMADKMVQSGGVKGLNKANLAKFQVYKSMAKEVVANMKTDHRKDAMRNFDTNMDKAINGTALNMPDPLQAKVEKQQQREREQIKQNEMELER